jgi:hypothetical protein
MIKSVSPQDDSQMTKWEFVKGRLFPQRGAFKCFKLIPINPPGRKRLGYFYEACFAGLSPTGASYF